MQYCFSRYRSYRPEDNTYQPYSGGAAPAVRVGGASRTRW
ncbi:BA14K family protein [Mesorhizobium sp. M0622]